MVEPEKPAHPLATFDRTVSPYCIGSRADESVSDPLVVAPAVVVLNILANQSSKVAFPDRNDLRQTLRLDRSDESLGMGVQIRATARELHGTDARTL